MIGRQISRYRVLTRIGAGGMGEVYLADDSSLARRVALKMLPPAIAADASARQRLFREAQAVASLDQPFICKVYDAGVDADVAFIAMEYVDGMTIRDRLVRGPIPIDEAVRLGGEIADALEFAHARRIVHRDLKPSNVMITPDGGKLGRTADARREYARVIALFESGDANLPLRTEASGRLVKLGAGD